MGARPGRPARRRADRRRSPDDLRTALRPTRRGRSRARGSGRAARAAWPPSAAAPEPRSRRWPTRLARAAGPPGRAGARPASPPPLWPATRERRRTPPRAGWLARLPARGPRVAQGHASARPSAAGTRPPRRARRAPARVRPTARARRRPPRRVPVPLRRGARHDGPRRPAASVTCASVRCTARRSCERRRSIDRRAHQRMEERHAFADRQQPFGLVRSRGREPDARVARPRATRAEGRRRAPPRRPAAAAASPRGAPRVAAGSSPRSARTTRAPLPARTRPATASRPTPAAARGSPAGCRASPR